MSFSVSRSLGYSYAGIDMHGLDVGHRADPNTPIEETVSTLSFEWSFQRPLMA